MKPSPVPAILLFVGTALLLFSLLGRGWYTANEESFSMAAGPIRSEVCFETGGEMECQSSTVFSDLGKGSMGGMRILSLLFVLTGISGAITAGIAGALLLGKPRSALALVTLILIGVAALIALGMLFYGLTKGGKSAVPGYGFFAFLIGAGVVIAGSIMAMRRGGPAPRPGGYAYPPQGAQYGYGGPPGYPQGGQGYPQGGQGYPPGGQGYPPGGQGYPPGGQGYPPGGQQGYPQSGPAPSGPAPGYAAPGQPPAVAQPQPQPVATPPAGALDGVQAPAQAGPGHTCGTSMTWVAQYNRWFCARCNQYG